MGKRRFIVLDIQADYPLKSINPNIFYRVTLNKEEKRYANFFILNGGSHYIALTSLELTR